MTREEMPSGDQSSSRNSGALAIAWIGEPMVPGGECGAPGDAGRWGGAGELNLPLDDRGLLLADGLFETVLLERGAPRLLELHQERWQQGAALLGLPPPPALEIVQALAAEAVRRSGIQTGALRLNWSRGAGGRGLELPPAGSCGRFWLQLSAWQPRFTPMATIVSPTEQRSSTSLLSRCKTFAYGSSIQARRQARAAGADDALLRSTAGGLCCGTAANLLLRHHGRWLTPSLTSGCLPGVMRRRALELGVAVESETPIELDQLRQGAISGACLLNSLGCQPLHRCEDVTLEAMTSEQAEALWRSLL